LGGSHRTFRNVPPIRLVAAITIVRRAAPAKDTAMTDTLRMQIIAQQDLNQPQRDQIVALCSRAYQEDFSTIVQLPADQPVHILAYATDTLVSHALWFTRILSYNGVPLRSAYVEAVATQPAFQGRGYASTLLRDLAGAITSYDLGVLSPFDPAFYTRLGWENWRGSLFVTTESDRVATPEDRVMILRLPQTPPLDLTGSLCAPWREGEIW
jgi:aminoglycoside 2'-N-acetyltransferase I